VAGAHHRPAADEKPGGVTDLHRASSHLLLADDHLAHGRQREGIGEDPPPLVAVFEQVCLRLAADQHPPVRIAVGLAAVHSE